MTVRFATFNVENLFARPKAFSLPEWSDGEPILAAYSEFNALAEKPVYSAADKARMVELLLRLDVYRRDGQGVVHRYRVPDPMWAWLRTNRGTFDVDHRDFGIEIVAAGRGSWIGWLELATAPTDEVSTRMTARVIGDLAADVLCVVEAEDRPGLHRFNKDLLAGQYGHCRLVDGNDPRGIDVGLFTSAEVVSMNSNVDVSDPGAPGESLFSRDCAEYRLRLASGNTVTVLLNHFKSQSGGGGGKRARQADGVLEIVSKLLTAGAQHIVVLGDLNEGPKQQGQPPVNLAKLFDNAGPLVSVYDLPVFDVGPRPGTFQSCGLANRLDYILVSKALSPLVTGGGVERRGLWGTPTNKNRPTSWQAYPEIESGHQAASDHAAVFIDVDL